MKIPDRLLKHEELAELLAVSASTIDEYERAGIIQRVPKLPSKRYNPEQIAILIGLDKETFSPFLYKKALQELEAEKNKNAYLENKLNTIKKVLGREA